MRAALYARVSTAEQRPDGQVHALKAYAKARGLKARLFVDRGASGAKERRPALDNLLEAVRHREVDLVVVQKLDRLARSVRHLTELGAEFEALGIGLVVLDQALDTTTPSGRLLFHVLGAIAEFERALLVERVRAGMAAAKRRGVTFGRPKALDRRAVSRARRLGRAGHSVREIAQTLGVGLGTVHRALAR